MPGKQASPTNISHTRHGAHPFFTFAIYSVAIYAMTTLIGIGAFLYPFWMPTLAQGSMQSMAHADDAPLMLSLLVGLCFVVLLLEVQGQSMHAKTVALLGVLVAINAILRFAEVAIPGPGGFSPIFLLIVLAGYVFGARFGFLMGVLTLFVSALITGTVGPWLPYQMFTAGWTGMSAPLCRPLVRALRGEGGWGEIVVLAIFAGIWGLLYGVVMNIWFWPYVAGPVEQYWTPGITVGETVQRYALFYVATSLVWDGLRLVGNVILVLGLGAPILRALRRFHHRFTFDYQPHPTRKGAELAADRSLSPVMGVNVQVHGNGSASPTRVGERS